MKVIHKIIEEIITPLLMLIFLLVIGIPLIVIEDIWHFFFPPAPDPREMSDEERRWYYGYDEREDRNE